MFFASQKKPFARSGQAEELSDEKIALQITIPKRQPSAPFRRDPMEGTVDEQLRIANKRVAELEEQSLVL